MKISFQPGLKFGENQVTGRVRGLHCTWLVPRTRASSNDVDGFFTLRVDPLEEGCSTLRAWPNRYLREHHIMLYGGTCGCFVIERSYGVWLVSTTRCRNLVPMASFWGSELFALMCLDLLRLPSCARNCHQATEVLGQEFLDQISPEGHIFILVPRGTQMPYSAAIDLVAGLGV
ncbi:hypothetical protein M9H77_01797 [Catharanthus roseus]|uniref:Uncharacterized protein n=1 Tax=Catharanthus roseus TaxID=4058 RepID=A0ACC0C6J7_CATRO|nr:hypothetical protein M9H77_01797 [Catharanthus roseus]